MRAVFRFYEKAGDRKKMNLDFNTTLQSIEHYIGSRRKELRTELDILESVDQDTVDPDDMMQQMLLHLLKTFFREAKD